MLPRHSTVLLAVLATKLTLTNAHIILESPKPYKFAGYGASNPIEPDGSDWPCKMPPGTTKLEISGTPTQFPIGQEQKISFTGTAVHGGGSCQFALLPGFSPSKTNADFRVLKSVEGGCPSANQKGNLEGGKPDTFGFTVPEGVEDGEYTFAWTWINRIGGGNEYYMNCAPVVVTGGKDKKGKGLKEYPGLFLANMGDVSGGCVTQEARTLQVAIKYPNPGDVVEHPEGEEKLFKQACDGNKNTGGGASEPKVPETKEPSSAVSSKMSASSTIPSSAEKSKLPSTLSTSFTPKPSVAPTLSAPAAVSSAEIPSNTPDSSGPPETPPGKCHEGHLLCVNRTMFSICTGGQWTGPQPLGANTHCEEGEGVGLKMVNEA